MRVEKKDPEKQMVDVLAMVRRLADIVDTYGPKYAHGEPTVEVVRKARQMLVELAPAARPRFQVITAAELTSLSQTLKRVNQSQSTWNSK